MWPFDARIRTNSVNNPWRSDDSNEYQDRIVDCHRDQTKVCINGSSEVDGGGLPIWAKDSHATLEHGWIAKAGGGVLVIPLDIQGLTAVVKAVAVKYYILTAVGLSIRLYEIDTKMSSAGSAPAITLLQELITSAGTPPFWEEIAWTGLSYDIDDEKYLAIEVANNDAGDKIAGVRVLFGPITPTP